MTAVACTSICPRRVAPLPSTTTSAHDRGPMVVPRRRPSSAPQRRSCSSSARIIWRISIATATCSTSSTSSEPRGTKPGTSRSPFAIAWRMRESPRRPQLSRPCSRGGDWRNRSYEASKDARIDLSSPSATVRRLRSHGCGRGSSPIFTSTTESPRLCSLRAARWWSSENGASTQRVREIAARGSKGS